MKTYVQFGPSCDLDENGDPRPPKHVKATVGIRGPTVIREPSARRRQKANR